MPDSPATIRIMKKPATKAQTPVKTGVKQAIKTEHTLLTALSGAGLPSRPEKAPAPAVSSSNPPAGQPAGARAAKTKASRKRADARYVARELMWSINEAREGKNYTIHLKALELLGKHLGMFGPQAENTNQSAFKVEYSVSPAITGLLRSLRETEGGAYE